MLGRRRGHPVLARVPDRPGGRTRPGSLDRTELDAFADLLHRLSGSRVVLTTGYEGRSTVALGLAAAAVAGGRRTVLVECDLARPTLASTLGLAEAPGLAEYLRYEAESAHVLQSVVLAGPASGRAAEPLVCIVAGAPTSHGPTLLTSQSFRHMIEKLRNAYEVVAVNGPAIDDEHSLLAVAAQAEKTLACCGEREIPKSLHGCVDGVVVRAT